MLFSHQWDAEKYQSYHWSTVLNDKLLRNVNKNQSIYECNIAGNCLFLFIEPNFSVYYSCYNSYIGYIEVNICYYFDLS